MGTETRPSATTKEKIMTRTIKTLLFGGLAALGLTLASPQTSQAQAPVGVQIGVGPIRFGYQQGYGYPGGYAYPAPVAPIAPAVPVAPVYPAPVVVPAAPVVTGGYYYGRPYIPYYRYGHYHYHR
jgi:hypothetical protein